jgi:S1-C subfamily serine protease
MLRGLVCVLFLACSASRASAACLDPALFAPSIVSLTREFSEDQRKVDPQVLGFRGTGWFLSSRFIVTAAHVAEAMQLSTGAWTDLQIQERDRREASPVRLVRIAGSHAEKLAILELGTPYPGATALPLRTEPLVPEEPVVAVGYPGGRLRTAHGRFVQFGADDRTAGAALLEMYDGNDRLVLDHGSSGAPVLNCAGQVVAVVANMFSQTLRFQSQVIRVSPPWQSPNVVALPIDVIRDVSWLE